MRQRPHTAFFRFSHQTRRPVALILALMIGWTGVPLDPWILADGYYDGEGNWIVDNSYNPGYTDPGYTDPGYTDPGYTDPGYTDPGNTDPGNTDPGYTDPGYTDPGSSQSSYDPWFDASSGIDSDGDGLDDYTEVWGFAIPLITVHSSSTYTETTNPETGETYIMEVPYESVEETSTWITTDPTNHDTDYDGLPDGYERDHELNPTSPYDGQTDADGDSLNRGLEYHYGTDPFHTDTDRDGFCDFEEVLFLGSNPLDRSDPVPVSVSNPHPVSPDPVNPAAATGEGISANDGGTAPNPVENNPTDTNPENGATALTAEWILWQAQHFVEHLAGDPADPQADGEADPDRDTLTNVEEFLLGTDPLNSDSDQDGLLDSWEVAGLVLHYDRTETPEPSYTPAPGESGYHGYVYGIYQFQHSTTIYDTDQLAEIGLIESWVRSVYTYDKIWGLTGTTLEYLDRTGYYNHQGALVFPEDGWVVDEIGQLVPAVSGTPAPTTDTEPTWSEVFDETMQMWVGTSTSGRTTSTWWWVHTDPLDADSDGDAMPDGWEYENWLHPKKASDSTTDSDTDALTNLAEYLEGTDPWTRDTDADTLSDGHEVSVSLTDPLDPADPGVTVESETPGTGHANSSVVSRYQSFGGVGVGTTTQAAGASGLSARSQQPRFSKNLQPGRAPQKQSNQPTQDDELYLETRYIHLVYGQQYDFIDSPWVEDIGAIDGHWEERFDAETNEFIQVWIQTGGGGGSVPQTNSEQSEPPKHFGSISWKANGQFQYQESKDHDHDSATKAYLLGQTIPSDTNWDADIARSYCSGASAEFTTHDVEEDGRTLRSGSGYQMEVRLVRKDGSGSNGSYLTVEKDVEKTFLKIVKSRPSPYNQSDEWTIDSSTEIVTLKIPEGDSMSVEDGETPVDDAVLKPEIRDGRITSVSLVPIEYEFVELLPDGSVGEVVDPELSSPSPVVTVSDFDADVELTTDLAGDTVLKATLHLQGSIDDALADITPGDAGRVHDHLYIIVNDEDRYPIPINHSKQDSGQPGWKQYDYTGTFDDTIEVEVTEGTNTIQLVALGKSGEEGYSLHTFDVQVTSPLAGVGGSARLSLDADPTPATADEASIDLGNGQFISLTETGLDSLVFSGISVDGTDVVVAVSETSMSTWLNGSTEFLNSTLSLDSVSYDLLFQLAEAGTREFEIALPEAGSGADSVSASEPVFVKRSEPGVFQPFLTRLKGGKDLPFLAANLPPDAPGNAGKSLSLETKFNEVLEFPSSPEATWPQRAPDERTFVSYDGAGADPQDRYLSNKDGTLPEVGVVAHTWADGLRQASLTNFADKIMAEWKPKTIAEGAAQGILYSGLDILMGGARMTEWTTQKGAAYLEIVVKDKQGGIKAQFDADVSSLIAGTISVGKQAAFIGKLLAESKIDQGKFIVAMLTQDEETLQALGSKYERALSLSAEVMAYAAEEVKSLDEGEQGVIMGALIFEILTNLIPGGQAKHVTKAKMLDDLAVGRFASSSPGGRVFAKVMLLLEKIRTTKMCFIAGTMVMSAQGAVPIEAVRPGMEVWARDEFTKAEGWKPVLQTFTTHPEELFTLGYDTDGDGAADDELTGTGEHPFWVEDHGEFLPMRDLRPGMRLSLAREGGTAIVTGNVSKRGPPGERFTTYNFEVAEFHTYFVGSAGVWVHNTGDAPCQLARAMMETQFAKHGDVWEAFRESQSHFSLDDISMRTRLRMFNETRTEYLTGRWGGALPPWEDIGKQTLRNNEGNSQLLGRNLKSIGIEAPWGDGNGSVHAHHICPKGMNSNSPRWQQCRDMLAQAGIDIDEAANGTFLRANNTIDMPELGLPHQGLHTPAYAEELFIRLSGAGPGGMRFELQVIADEIAKGIFPH